MYMKKNIAHAHSLLLLPLIASFSLLGMEGQAITTTNDQKKDNFEESVLMPSIPTTRGLGFTRGLKDYIWNEEENTYTELIKKQIDLTNSSYHRKLDTAVEIYSSTRKNSDRLASVLTLCRQEPYKGFIKINDIPSSMAHIYLVQENKTKQTNLKNTIEEKDKAFIENYNGLLEDLQDSVAEKIETMNTLLNCYIKSRDGHIQDKGNEIRVLKKALVNLHHLNKTFKLPEDKKTDGYCSDEEKNTNNVDTSYNDKYLLDKIDATFLMNETKTKIERLLLKLLGINREIQEIQAIRY